MIPEAQEEISVAEPRDVQGMTEMFCYFLKERRRQSGRGLFLVALSCLALTASACGGGMSFDSAQTSFRRFSECALIEDFPGRNLKLKEAWLQNVVAEPDTESRRTAGTPSTSTTQEASSASSTSSATSSTTQGASSASSTSSATSDQFTDEDYVVTGVVRAVTDHGSLSRDLAILRVRKVLGEYKVVNWATNIDREVKRNPQTLLVELRSNLYRGRCSW
jgi:hypothetical protein